MEHEINGNLYLPSVENQYLHKALKLCDIAFAALYVNVPVWSMIDQYFRFAAMLNKFSNLVGFGVYHKDQLVDYYQVSYFSHVHNYKRFWIKTPKILKALFNMIFVVSNRVLITKLLSIIVSSLSP